MTSYYLITCVCGHEGKIRLRENDTPYGSESWEKYSLVDLEGSTYSGINADWETIFAVMMPVCPRCKSVLTVKDMK